jgi:hypothetical protein
MKIGAAQVGLMNYFSQNIQQADETVTHTAHYLLKAYPVSEQAEFNTSSDYTCSY